MTIRQRILLFALIFALPLLTLFSVQKKLLIVEGQTFGTYYVVKAYVPIWVSKLHLTHRIESELSRLDSIFSTWNPESEISQLNQAKANEAFTLSNDFKTVFDEAYHLYNSSSGYYDPSIKPLLDLWGFSSSLQYFKVPAESELKDTYAFVGLNKFKSVNGSIIKTDGRAHLDLSSLAKGYAVDQLALLLEGYRSKRYMIEIGGEIKVRSDSRPWTLGITKPSYQIGDQDLFTTLSLKSASIATSGDYRNFFQVEDNYYSHIFDPILKKPVSNNIASVTVITKSCMLADAMATAIMALGKGRGLAIVEALEGVECMIIYRDGDAFHPYFSSGFQEFIKH